MSHIARFGSASAAALALVLGCAAACADPRAEPPSAGARPDPATQARIEEIAGAIVRQDERAPELLDALAASAGGRRRELLLQLALYLAASTGTEQSMAGALMLDRLEFTPDEKIETVLPNLRDAPGPLRKVLVELLGTIDRPGGAAADFGVYESRLKEAWQSPPAALVVYMYEVSPDAALRAMRRVHGAGGTGRDAGDAAADVLAGIQTRHAGATAAWPADDLAKARAALDALCNDPAWWRRAYAAAILRGRTELATPAVTRRLAGDPSSLVRAILAP